MIKASVLGSVMIVTVLILRAFFGKRLPRVCFKLLWALAAIRLLLPFSFTFDVEIEVETQVTTPHYLGETQQEMVLNGFDGVPANVQSASVNEIRQTEKAISTADVLRCIHAIGMALSGGFMAYAYFRMRRTAMRAKALPPHLNGRWDNVTVRHGDGFSSPFSCGVIKPIIFIPSHMLTIDADRLDNIIEHEKQHIRACDQLYKWLIAASACLHWYNPLAWIAVHFASRDTELVCDEAVVRKIGKRSDYALTLIEAEENRASFAVCSFGAPVLSERIESIMKSKKTTIGALICAGAVLAAMTVFFVGVNANYVESEDNTAVKTTDTVSAAVETASAEEASVENDNFAEVEHMSETVQTDVNSEKESIRLICPLADHNGISRTFGYHTNMLGEVMFSNGVNVAAEKGASVYAAAEGSVICAQYNPDTGYIVEVEHENGCITAYTHLNEIMCEVGDNVASGEQIATVGATGYATGPNLGFSVLVDGAYVDPALLFE